MSYKIKLKSISTFIFDVDGVLTDGKVYLFRDEHIRAIHSKDKYAIQYAAKMGYSIFVITGGSTVSVQQTLMGLGAKDVRLKSSNKISVYEDLKKKHGFTDDEVLYMGDDLPDYRVMQQVGVSTCPQDAATEIRQIASYQSPFLGGGGCVRDIIEQTLRVQGKWFGELSHEW
ncbi:MAG: HAD hydrolase family protein [Brumimicrobium sp.]|nr:HAD hydrolase family protein [Brumimicrobium sp.]